jgi:hypothetical protein
MWRVLLCIAGLLGTNLAQGATEVDDTCRSFVRYDGKKQCLLFTYVEDEKDTNLPEGAVLAVTNPTEGEVVEILPPTKIPEGDE